MKTKVTVVILTLLMLSSLTLFGQDKKKDDNKEKTLFDVSMTCENCKRRIEKNIAFEKGVTDMKVDLAAKTVEVEYRKDKTSVEKLEKAFEKLGYKATIHNNDLKEQEK